MESEGAAVEGTRKVRAVPLCIKPTDLVVSGNSRTANLDDVHVISGQIELPMTGHELSKQVLLCPGIVSAFVFRPEL